MDNLVATCGALWSLCSPAWRVQEMKVVAVMMMIVDTQCHDDGIQDENHFQDHYLEVLLGKNKATVDIEQCTVVGNLDIRNLDIDKGQYWGGKL